MSMLMCELSYLLTLFNFDNFYRLRTRYLTDIKRSPNWLIIWVAKLSMTNETERTIQIIYVRCYLLQTAVKNNFKLVLIQILSTSTFELSMKVRTLRVLMQVIRLRCRLHPNIFKAEGNRANSTFYVDDFPSVQKLLFHLCAKARSGTIEVSG